MCVVLGPLGEREPVRCLLGWRVCLVLVLVLVLVWVRVLGLYGRIVVLAVVCKLPSVRSGASETGAFGVHRGQRVFAGVGRRAHSGRGHCGRAGVDADQVDGWMIGVSVSVSV